MSRIAVLLPQVPFVRGGAEAKVQGLVAALGREGHEACVVTLPYKWYPRAELLKQPLLWRLLDLSEADGRRIDLVIGTKFPSYCAIHPNKVVWLTHQFRQIYDLWGTPYSDFTPEPQDEAVREAIQRADRIALGEAKKIFSIARNTTERLRRYSGLEAETLYHPPPLAPRLRARPAEPPGDYILSVGRLDDLKRIELLVEAASHAPGVRVRIAGTGPARATIERRIRKLRLGDRVELLGRVADPELVDLYLGARAVWFAPFDEDYGYVTLESFLARRPVVTTSDAGGVLEWVSDGETGCVAPPEAEPLGAILAELASNRDSAEKLGRAGHERVQDVTWENAVRRILAAGGLA